MGDCSWYLLGSRVGGVGVATVEHDPGALFGEQFGDRETDAASAADDDGAAARQAAC